MDPYKPIVMPVVAADQCFVNSERSFSTLPPVSRAYASAMTALRLVKAKTYSFIAENQAAHQTACFNSIGLAAQNKIKLVCNITVPISLGKVTNASIDAWRAAIDTISQCEQDVVVMCAYSTSALVMLKRA